MPSSPSSSSSGSEASPSPIERRKKCAKRPGRKMTKGYDVSPKKKTKTGKKRSPYHVAGRCIKKGKTVVGHAREAPKTAWMMLLTTLHAQNKDKMSYGEAMAKAQKLYAKYKKTHAKADGTVHMSRRDIMELLSVHRRK